MSWIVENTLTGLQQFCVNVVKRGAVPRHVAFIMDGNRRFARKAHAETVVGHTRGFEKLAETLHWCRALGISEVTVYAFSIENFKRSPREVDELMQLAREKYARLLNERDKLMENGVCIRVIGNLELIPEDIRGMMSEAILLTRHNNRAFLNVAFAYTARDEITQSIKTVVEGVHKRHIVSESINHDLLTQCLYTHDSPEPDIIVRTSGEVRFSDFLLWQLWRTNVLFTEVLWPEFSIWHLLACVVQYQRCYKSLCSTKSAQQLEAKRTETSDGDVDEFLIGLRARRLEQLDCNFSSS